MRQDKLLTMQIHNKVLVLLKKIKMDHRITYFSIFEASQMDQLLHCIVEHSHRTTLVHPHSPCFFMVEVPLFVL